MIREWKDNKCLIRIRRVERPYQNRGNQQTERQQFPNQNDQRVERQQVPDQNTRRRKTVSE